MVKRPVWWLLVAVVICAFALPPRPHRTAQRLLGQLKSTHKGIPREEAGESWYLTATPTSQLDLAGFE